MIRIICISLAFLLLLVTFAFTGQRNARPPVGLQYSAFAELTDSLLLTSERYRRGEADLTRLRTSVAETRLAYKRIGWLVEYYYPAYAGKHFNGAPLLKAEKYGTHSTVAPPEGLQVLDEMAWEPAPDAAQFAILARKLRNHARQLAGDIAARPYPLDEVIEAIRIELIRIPTLYLTGFDTPGSLNGIPESRAALEALTEALRRQTDLVKYAGYGQQLSGLQRAAAALGTTVGFADFDRLGFQRNYLNGLYRGLSELQQAAGLQPRVRFPTGRNPTGQLLFADDFLDPYAYTELTADEDSPALRALGRQLFYDTGLSGDGSMSCASCHRPERAFTDGKGATVRNAPTLVNAVYADRYFYDLRAFSLEQQAEHVIYDHSEFNTSYAAIVERLREDAGYRQRFREAFGAGDNIDRDRFSAALASYVVSLRSFNSPFDRYARGETDTLDPEARAGYNLFMGKAACGTCHFAPTFSGLVPPAYTENESEILGVLERPVAWTNHLDPDRGRAAGGLPHENVWIYERSFKTPTVRNVALTAPYFHNGAYATLEQVVDFYNRGGGEGMGLEVPNQTLAPDSLGLTDTEQRALISFMEALSDPLGE